MGFIRLVKTGPDEVFFGAMLGDDYYAFPQTEHKVFPYGIDSEQGASESSRRDEYLFTVTTRNRDALLKIGFQ